MTQRYIVIIPALNAENTLAPVVSGALAYVDEVLVIDDGSADRTAEVAASSGATVLRHDVNRGKGAALRTGFRHALERGCAAVITLDADGQHLPSDIPRFIDEYRATGADLIIGGRSHLFWGMLPQRRLANRFSAWAISNASGVPVSDSQSGFRLYSTHLLGRVTLRSDRFDMESEVIVRAGRGGFKVSTVPIGLGFVDGVSTSHYRPVVDTFRIAWAVLRTRFFR
ncbi:MAG TPA: glycosyltransferase family 2 protein [Thermoanaerobaculia bacterium]|nr:glycosyltransferase family 2 protein [Thermoanaerobaculia bacterium]